MKTLLLMAGVLATATLAAQSLDVARDKQAPSAPAGGASTPAFEVASVKRNKSGEAFVTVGMQPGGRLTLVNMAVRQMIVRAYQVQPFQVLGGPSWLTSDRFDVTAKGEDGTTPPQTNAMLQALLADRFKLKIHRETRESDVYRLVKARADGKLGESLKPSTANCGALLAGRPGGPGPTTGAGAPVPAPGAAPGPPIARLGGPPGPGGPMPACRMMMAPGRFELLGQTLASFASTLANQLARPVIDETGLTGLYDFTLTYMPDTGGRGGLPPAGAPDLPPIDPNAPVLPTALQEQLGLKLESTKGPVEMIVIDSIEPPTED